MYKTQILIISERKELAIKYKKLIENLNQEVIYTNDLSKALEIIHKKETEFIIISDTIKEKISSFIKKIRVLTYNFRPIIIAISKSSDLKDRLEALENGADDFLGEEITKQEFKMRFRAHLRRYIESFLNPITHMPDKNIVIKALKQTFLNENNFSYFLIKIKGGLLYRKTHGEIAYEKVIKTLSAIINSTLSKNDFVGHLGDDEFVLITNPLLNEQISSFLTFAFDNILNKFYSNDEFQNKFILENSDNIKETKQGLMHLNIAVCDKTNKNDYRDILNNLYELENILNDDEKSSYIIDRTKLSGEITENKKNKVLIFEFDEALSFLLKNVCELNKIEVQIAKNTEEFNEIYNSFNPNVVLLDWGYSEDSETLKLAQKISKDDIKLIFSSSYLNKKEILKSGVDLYIPKPYEIEDIIKSIKGFLK